MSIVGTRPPLISETNLYELHHRARLAIKPGITGMWQVSGRSDITDFEESYGYLTGSYVRDKDGVDGAYMICEMFSYYATKGINGLSLARMKMEMIFLRLSSAGSIPLNGNREMSLIIRLMMRRTVICTWSIRKWQMHKKR